jgi:hypothetical protein
VGVIVEVALGSGPGNPLGEGDGCGLSDGVGL